MNLKTLLQDIPEVEIRGAKEKQIIGITASSQSVAPGYLFIAKRGLNTEGSRFVIDAARAGAAAILTDLYDPFLDKNVVQVIHPHPASLEGLLAARYYGYPNEKLLLIGVTGTNGKTTMSYEIKHLFDQMNIPLGLIGTIESIVGEHSFPSTYTTPDVISTNRLLHDMVKSGCQGCVMEVSSHGLMQGRVDSLHFDIALFTNLTQDHLDYHKTMEEYAAAKAMLFETLRSEAYAVVNIDSPWHARILEQCRAQVITYGFQAGAHVRAVDVVLGPQGSSFNVEWELEVVKCEISLIGTFNVSNALGAIACGLCRGFPLQKLVSALKCFQAAPGRLQRVYNRFGLNVFVDYAHTEDALKNVLEILREITKGKVITVFGCGGDRDRAKRPKMGRVASALSDVCIVTTDNPRSEDPDQIIQEICSGVAQRKSLIVEPDRKQAIERALECAGQEDIVLIAGKGHEKTQIFAHRTVEFDDCSVAQAAIDCISIRNLK